MKPTSDPLFDAFWQAFPRRDAKGAAERAWKAAVKLESPTRIIEGAKAYARLRASKGPEEAKFTCMPSTWLNQRRWGDAEIAEPAEEAQGPAPERRTGPSLSEATRALMLRKADLLTAALEDAEMDIDALAVELGTTAGSIRGDLLVILNRRAEEAARHGSDQISVIEADWADVRDREATHRSVEQANAQFGNHWKRTSAKW